MQPDYKYKTYKPRSTSSNTYDYTSTNPVSDTERLKKSLGTQAENLEKRLVNSGVDPNDLGSSDLDNRNLAQKILNLPEDQNFLFDVFEILDRPVQGVKNMIKSASDGENPLEGLIDGISGNQEITTSELLDDLGIIDDAANMSGFGKFAVNFAGDVLLDPLTWFPPIKMAKKLGLLSDTKAINKMADEAATQAKRLEELRGLQKAGNLAGDQVDELKRLEQTAGKTAEDLAKPSNIDPQTGAAQSQTSVFDVETAMKETKTKTTSGARKQQVKMPGSKDALQKKGIKGIIDWASAEGAGGIGAQIDAVFGAMRLFVKKLGNFSDDVILKMGGINGAAGALFNDIDIWVKHSDGLFYKVGKQIDVKQFFKGTPFGKIVGDGFANLGYLSFQKGSKGSVELAKTAGKGISTDRNVIEELFKEMIDAKIPNAKKLKKILNDILDGKVKSLNAQGDAIGKELNDALKKLYMQKYADEWLMVPTFGFGDTKLYKASKLLDHLEFKIKVGRGKSKKGLSIFMGLKKGSSVDNILDDSADFFNDLVSFEKQSGLIKKVGVNIANNAIASQYNILSTPASFAVQSYQAAKNALGRAFVYGYGLKQSVIDRIRAIGGEAGHRMMELNSRLAAVQKALNSKDPRAAELLNEIIENARFYARKGTGPKSGTRRFIEKIGGLNPEMEAQEVVNYLTASLAEGNVPLLYKFTGKSKENFKKALDDINKAFSVQYPDLNLRIVESNGAFRLATDLNHADMLKFSQDFASSGLAKNKLRFGVREISEDARKFFDDNIDEINEFLNIKDDVLGILEKEIGFNNLPTAFQQRYNYMRHTLSPEGRKALRGTLPAAKVRGVSPGTDMLKQRNYIGSIEEVNQGLREFNKIDFDMLDADAFNSLEDLIRVAATKEEQGKVLYALLSGSSETGTKLFRVFDNNLEAAEELGDNFTVIGQQFKDADDFSALYKNLSPQMQKSLDRFFTDMGWEKGKAIAMHKSAYDILAQVNRTYKEMNGLVKIYDKFLNLWKSVTLVSPGFHLRNMFGNMFNMRMSGMSFTQQFRYSQRAMLDFNYFRQYQDLVAREGLDAITDSKAKEAYKRVVDYFESGASQTRKGIRDLEGVKKNLQLARKTGDEAAIAKAQQAYNKAVQFNFAVAEKMDDFQRYTLYSWALENSGKEAREFLGEFADDLLIKERSRVLATRKVSESLFDYSHLTGIEKQYIKRLFPFYTFMKNNFVFQVKNLVKNPGRVANVGRAYNYFNEDMMGLETEKLPDYVKGQMWVPILMNVQKNDEEAISFLKLNLPISDFTEFVEEPFKRGASSLVVPVKIIAELAFGRDSFTDQELIEYPGESSRMLKDEGVFADIRNEDGELAVSSNPLTQKLFDDLGMRVPRNYASIAMEVIDTIFGFQTPQSLATNISDRFSLTGTQSKDTMEVTSMYQDLEKLRNLKSYYEQEKQESLPTLRDLGLD